LLIHSLSPREGTELLARVDVTSRKLQQQNRALAREVSRWVETAMQQSQHVEDDGVRSDLMDVMDVDT
jgi:hypothetical protein